MQIRRCAGAALRVAAGAYPLLVFALCRRGVTATEPWELAILYLALGLPLVFLALWAANAFAAKHLNLKLPIFLLLLLALGVAIWRFAQPLQHHYRWMFLIQDSAFFALLAYYFASSLRAGREPLCTFFARLVHRTLSPALLQYTRLLTKVWAVFFIFTGALSSLLFFFASNSVWAFFTNLLMPFLTLGVFVVDNACRRLVLPPEDHIGLWSTFTAVRKGGLTAGMRTSAAQPKTAG